jgi:hypothetical protein
MESLHQSVVYLEERLPSCADNKRLGAAVSFRPMLTYG